MADNNPQDGSCPQETAEGDAASSTPAPAPPLRASTKSGNGRPPGQIHDFYVKHGQRDTVQKRTGVACKFCKGADGKPMFILAAKDARPQKMIPHSLICPHMPEEHRAIIQQLSSNSNATAPASSSQGCSNKRPRSSSQTTLHQLLGTGPCAMTQDKKAAADMSLLLWAIEGAVGLNTTQLPHFGQFISLLNPGYKVPSVRTLRELLPNAYNAVLAKQQEKIDASGNLTLMADCWTDRSKRSVTAFYVAFPDRTMLMLNAVESSMEQHTAVFLKDEIIKAMELYRMKDKVAMLVTDNAANIKLARQLVVQEAGCKHIINMYCAMHGFNLLLTSVLAHPWAQQTVIDAQCIVTYFRAATRPLALLRDHARANGINTGLHTSNATRFTSKFECTKSVAKLEPAFQLLLRNNRDAIKSDEVVALLDDRSFWSRLDMLNQLLEPVVCVLMGVQADNTTLADVARYWLYLMDKLGAAVNNLQLPTEYKQHLIWGFAKRAKQQDMPLCRLALFLDPRYRQAAMQGASSGMTGLLVAAAELAKAQGWAEERTKDLMAQMSAYSSGEAPFDVAVPGLCAKAWWRCVASSANAAELAEVAGILLDVVPHAGAGERGFSHMGLFESGKVTRLSSATNKMKTTIKLWHNAYKRKVPHRSNEEERIVPEAIDLTGPAHIAAAALSSPTLAGAAQEAADAQRADAAGAGEEEVDEETPDELREELQQHWEAEQQERNEQHDQQPPPQVLAGNWRATLLWAAGVERGQDLLRPDYQEHLALRMRRSVGPPANFDAAALAAEHARRQAEADAVRARERAAAAERAAEQAARLAMNPSGLQQDLAMQALLLAQHAEAPRAPAAP